VNALRDILGEAWRELWRARLRTLLAILGITVGAAAITCLASMHQLDWAFEARARASGWMTVTVPKDVGGERSRGPLARKPHLSRTRLTLGDAAAIREQCPAVESVVIRGDDAVTCRAGRKSTFSLCEATSAQSATERQASGEWRSLRWGRFFTPEEMAAGAQVVVINERLRKELYGDAPLTVLILRINGYRYTLIGVARAPNEIDSSLLIPYTCVGKLQLPSIMWYFQALPKRQAWDRARREIDAVLVRRLGDPGGSFVVVDNPLAGSKEGTIISFLGLLGFLTLLSTGVATSNKIYTDVLERLDQFALRRALGATRPRIYAAVLCESIVLLALGCLLGGAAGLWAFYKQLALLSSPTQTLDLGFPVLPLLALLGTVVSIGIAAGMQGAAMAAHANPAAVMNRKDAL
jgi:putative ABC transport system permease protein